MVNEIECGAEEYDEIRVVLNQSPFYAESGGQIGDQGTISWDGGFFKVIDTQSPVEGVICHHGWLEEGTLYTGQDVQACVDEETRADIARNHTATHLLHKALKDVLGEHVNQSGSHVGQERLRFDFTHYEGLTPEELTQVEDLINKTILDNLPVETFYHKPGRSSRDGGYGLFSMKAMMKKSA